MSSTTPARRALRWRGASTAEASTANYITTLSPAYSTTSTALSIDTRPLDSINMYVSVMSPTEAASAPVEVHAEPVPEAEEPVEAPEGWTTSAQVPEDAVIEANGDLYQRIRGFNAHGIWDAAARADTYARALSDTAGNATLRTMLEAIGGVQVATHNPLAAFDITTTLDGVAQDPGQEPAVELHVAAQHLNAEERGLSPQEQIALIEQRIQEERARTTARIVSLAEQLYPDWAYAESLLDQPVERVMPLPENLFTIGDVPRLIGPARVNEAGGVLCDDASAQLRSPLFSGEKLIVFTTAPSRQRFANGLLKVNVLLPVTGYSCYTRKEQFNEVPNTSITFKWAWKGRLSMTFSRTQQAELLESFPFPLHALGTTVFPSEERITTGKSKVVYQHNNARQSPTALGAVIGGVYYPTLGNMYSGTVTRGECTFTLRSGDRNTCTGHILDDEQFDPSVEIVWNQDLLGHPSALYGVMDYEDEPHKFYEKLLQAIPFTVFLHGIREQIAWALTIEVPLSEFPTSLHGDLTLAGLSCNPIAAQAARVCSGNNPWETSYWRLALIGVIVEFCKPSSDRIFAALQADAAPNEFGEESPYAADLAAYMLAKDNPELTPAMSMLTMNDVENTYLVKRLQTLNKIMFWGKNDPSNREWILKVLLAIPKEVRTVLLETLFRVTPERIDAALDHYNKLISLVGY